VSTFEFESLGDYSLRESAGFIDTRHGEVHGSADAAVVRAQTSRILSLDVDGRAWPDVARGDAVIVAGGLTARGSRSPCGARLRAARGDELSRPAAL
jgi:hypothetical protein